MQADAEIFFEHGKLGRPVALSVGLHLGLTGLIVLLSMYSGRSGATWGAGGGGDAMGVTLVSTIPLPKSSTPTQNVVANESKGLTKSQPQEKQVEPDAIPIPDKAAKVKAKPAVSASKAKSQPAPETESNEVPYGQGGPVNGPYGAFSANGAKGGFGFQGGGGDFGSRYAWYAKVVRDKITENWLKYEIDPNIHKANRVYLVFDITRSGQPTHVQIEQSSGVPSLDNSAIRALQRIDTFGPLPPEYSGSKVTVEFWFDLSR